MKEIITYLINPISGTKSKTKIPGWIEKLTDRTIYEPEIVFTQYKGEATEIVTKKLSEGYRYFVAVGGDGTVNEIGKALINSNGIMGIIPCGSGNGLARHLQIPLEPKEAIVMFNKKNEFAIDYGEINDLPFFCTCGVGFDALIGDKFALAKGRGLANYIKIAIHEFFNYKAEEYCLTIDNQPKITYKAFVVTFANGSQYGNNAYISPKADISDGLLDICILSPFSLLNAPVLGARLFLKNVDKSKLLKIHYGSQILLERNHSGVIHFDGEPRQMGKQLHIRIINKGLKILVP